MRSTTCSNLSTKMMWRKPCPKPSTILQRLGPLNLLHGENFDGLEYLLSLLGHNETLRKEYDAYTEFIGHRRMCCFKLEGFTQEHENAIKHAVGDKLDRLVWAAGTGLFGRFRKKLLGNRPSNWSNQSRLLPLID